MASSAASAKSTLGDCPPDTTCNQITVPIDCSSDTFS